MRIAIFLLFLFTVCYCHRAAKRQYDPNCPFLFPIFIDEFTISGLISATGQGSTNVQFNSGNQSQILGCARNMYAAQTSASKNGGISLHVLCPANPSEYGFVNVVSNSLIQGHAFVFYAGSYTLSQNPCGKATAHLNSPTCLTACPDIFTSSFNQDFSLKDGIAFLLDNMNVASGATFNVGIWTANGGYAYTSYTYNQSVSSSSLLPELFFPFDAFTQLAPINLTSVSAVSIEMVSNVPNLNLTINAIQVMGVNVMKVSDQTITNFTCSTSPNGIKVDESFSFGSSVSVGPGANVPFSLLFLPDIFQILPPLPNIEPFQYQVELEDTLPPGFSYHNSAPFTAVSYDLSNSMVSTQVNEVINGIDIAPSTPFALTTNTASGQTATATFTAINPQGIRVIYNVTTPSTFDFCRQEVINNASFRITTLGTTGFGKRTSYSTYILILQGNPILSTSFAFCPSDYTAFPQTILQICNTGTGRATNIQFSQTLLTGCKYVSSTPAASCSGGTCTVALTPGYLNPGSCTNVTVNFDCSYASSSVVPLNFTSTTTLSESCVSSTATSVCSFSRKPGLPQLVSTIPSCPTIYSSSVTTFGKICNTGNGTAVNVFYNQTYLTGCTASPATSNPGITCTGGYCTGHVGDLSPNACATAQISFDCSAYITTCSSATISTDLVGTETSIGATSTSPVCSFGFAPSKANLQASYTSCPTYSATTTTIAKICNIGTGDARNTQFNQSVLSGCTALSTGNPMVTCLGGQCTGNVGTITINNCITVSINFDCSAVTGGNVHSATMQSNLQASEACNDVSPSATCTINYTRPPPQLTTVFTTCPGSYSANQTTVAHTCNAGVGTATSVAFNQSVFTGCVPTVVSPVSVTCAAGFCSGNLGDLSTNACSDVTISFDCSSAINQSAPTTFISYFSSTETSFTESSSSSPCSFAYNPPTICKIISIISDFDYDRFDLSPPASFGLNINRILGRDDSHLDESFFSHVDAYYQAALPENGPTRRIRRQSQRISSPPVQKFARESKKTVDVKPAIVQEAPKINHDDEKRSSEEIHKVKQHKAEEKESHKAEKSTEHKKVESPKKAESEQESKEKQTHVEEKKSSNPSPQKQAQIKEETPQVSHEIKAPEVSHVEEKKSYSKQNKDSRDDFQDDDSYLRELIDDDDDNDY